MAGVRDYVGEARNPWTLRWGGSFIQPPGPRFSEQYPERRSALFQQMSPRYQLLGASSEEVFGVENDQSYFPWLTSIVTW